MNEKDVEVIVSAYIIQPLFTSNIWKSAHIENEEGKVIKFFQHTEECNKIRFFGGNFQ